MLHRLLTVIIFLLNTYLVKSQDKLPIPTGKYKVGTKVFSLIDNRRFDTLQNASRNIMIQLWYPGQRTKTKAKYILSSTLAKHLITSKYYGLDSSILYNLKSLVTNSLFNTQIQPASEKYPLLLFSTGLGVTKANYTAIYEELASYGIVILAIDHPYTGLTVLRNGKVVSMENLPREDFDQMMKDNLKDISFILDQLNIESDLSKFIKKSIDITSIGAAGHSIGGNLAMEASIVDHRIKYSINLDGGFFDHMKPKTVNSPCLIIRQMPDYSDADLKRRGRTRELWNAMGRKGDTTFAASYIGSKSPVFNIKIKGTGHFSFSDAPFIMPQLINQFGGTIIDGNRSHSIITKMMNSFIRSVVRKYDFSELTSLIQNNREVQRVK